MSKILMLLNGVSNFSTTCFTISNIVIISLESICRAIIDCVTGRMTMIENVAISKMTNLLLMPCNKSQLAFKEELVSNNEGEENLEVALFFQDWFGELLNTYGSGYDQEEEDDIGLSSSCSSPDENLYVRIDSSCSFELTACS